ncbi:hypothetical protein [Reyranella sp.]|uniref:hypothetical protein n=1 Tax=Reyranella sp. TaxID=1929291 RepID=UPI004036C657
MAKGWQIVVATERLGGSDPDVEHFIVAVADSERAVEVLRKRKKLTPDQKTLVFGEAADILLDFLNAKRGEVYAVAVVM